MKWFRIKAVILRHLLQYPRDLGRLSMLFYWPLIDIIIIGFTMLWLKNMNAISENLEKVVLSSIILWQVIVRSNLDISGSLLEEIWSHNMNNFFSTPITLAEWNVAVIFLSFGLSLLVFGYISLLSWFLYSFNILSLGWILVPVFLQLYISGMAMGFIAASILVYYGVRVHSLVFMMGYFLMPLSGVSYELDVLPQVAQYLAYLLPMSYIFEFMRLYILKSVLAWNLFGMVTILNIFYFSASIISFKCMFEKSREKGLARLVD